MIKGTLFIVRIIIHTCAARFSSPHKIRDYFFPSSNTAVEVLQLAEELKLNRKKNFFNYIDGITNKLQARLQPTANSLYKLSANVFIYN